VTTATAYAQTDEAIAVAALLRFAESHSHEHRAGPRPVSADFDDVDAEGLRLALDHGVSPERISAYRSLGRSRGLPLSDVLRAAFRNELRLVVELPAVERGRRRGPPA